MSFSEDPTVRNLTARAAANKRWAMCEDRVKATEPMRRGNLRRFEDTVDPDRKLPEYERLTRALQARRAFLQGIAAQSVAARRRKAL